MFARLTWSKATDKAQLDAGITMVRDRILPSFKTQPGFLGLVMLADANRTEGVTGSYWETAEAMTASDNMGNAARAEVAQTSGAQITEVDRFELLLQDRTAPPSAGTFVRTNDLRTATAQIDATVTFIRDSLPKLRPISGYRAALVFANRGSGRMIIASVWNTAEDREASNSAISGLRSQLAEITQAKDVRVTLYDAVLSEVSAPAQAAATPQSVS